MYIVCYDGGARISPNARSCPPRPYTGRGDGQGPDQGVLPRRLSRTPYGKLLYIELNTDAQKNTAGIAVPTVSFVSVAEIAVSVSRFTFVAGEPALILFFFLSKKQLTNVFWML